MMPKMRDRQTDRWTEKRKIPTIDHRDRLEKKVGNGRLVVGNMLGKGWMLEHHMNKAQSSSAL